jgi:hypothetical protein
MRELFQTLQKPIMLPKLVHLGKMHPEVARQNKTPMFQVIKWLVLTSTVAGCLFYTGTVRMTFFLMFTTLILPLFRTIFFPWAGAYTRPLLSST